MGVLIGWQSTRRQQIADVLPALVADYEGREGHPPGERTTEALDRQAAAGSRSPKPALSSLAELREWWRNSVIRKVGACTVYRLSERARAAAAAVWARVRRAVDIALAAVDTIAVVYEMRAGPRVGDGSRGPERPDCSSPAPEAVVKDADGVVAGVAVVPRRREGLSARVSSRFHRSCSSAARPSRARAESV
ncbi:MULTISPECIES: hypothetical protein [unclassified Streptomyces]|uniref:hypothetical protein n=1 Tax=unclassified Streptomyces TaxID=2593676 RepID=UPI002E2E139B|nr:hypothetical protein [Streptomyces sp. NBC_00190]